MEFGNISDMEHLAIDNLMEIPTQPLVVESQHETKGRFSLNIISETDFQM